MASVSADQITGIGISGQMMGAIFLDENFNPTRDAIIWADFRAQKQSDLLIEKNKYKIDIKTVIQTLVQIIQPPIGIFQNGTFNFFTFRF